MPFSNQMRDVHRTQNGLPYNLNSKTQPQSDFDLVPLTNNVDFNPLKFNTRKMETLDRSLISKLMSTEVINAKHVREGKQSHKRKPKPFFNSSAAQPASVMFGSPRHSESTVGLRASPSQEIFGSIMDRASDFKGLIDITKSREEMEQDRMLERELAQDVEKAKDSRKEFLKTQMREYNAKVSGKKENYNSRRRSVTKVHPGLK